MFSDLFKAYLAAFNEHDLDRVFSFISPSLQVYYDGKLVGENRASTAPNYIRHWEKLTQPIVLLEEPRELDDDDDDGAYGVQVSLADRDEGSTARVKYIYVQEDGKWVHIRHEIAKKEMLDDMSAKS